MTSSGTLTAAKVIRKECRFCIGAAQANCTTTLCKLHPDVFKCRSSVKRIKTHCQDCAVRDLSGSVHDAVRDRTGQLLRENGNTVRWIDKDGRERGVCFLHPYRFGKNPTRTKYPSPPKRKLSATPSRGPISALGPSISSESGQRGGER